MLLVIAIGFPARLYGYLNSEYFPLVNLFAIIFSIGFLFVLIDSIILSIKKTKVVNSRGKMTIWAFIGDYIISIIYIITISRLISLIMPDFFVENPIIAAFFSFFLVYCIQSFKLFKQKWMIAIVAICYIALLIIYKPHYGILQVYSYAVSLAVIVIRQQIEKYNYSIIEPEQLTAGMVLSAGTVLQFSGSKIQNLPGNPSESLKNRLCDLEVAAVVRWSVKNQEIPIVIIRKIPFAIFILIGMLVFLARGVYCADFLK
jgi:hypothetical protein